MSQQVGRRGPSGRSRTDWERLVAAYEHRGVSRKAFCADAGISVSSLDYWRRKLQEDREAVSSSGFIELAAPFDADPGVGSPWHIELVLGGGVVLKLSRR